MTNIGANEVRKYLKKCNTKYLEGFYYYIEMLLHERDMKVSLKSGDFD